MNSRFWPSLRHLGMIVFVGMMLPSFAFADISKPTISKVGDMTVEDSVVTLVTGGSQIVELPEKVQTASAVPGVVSINITSSRVAEIIAQKPGRVDVIFNGKTKIVRLHVTVSAPK